MTSLHDLAKAAVNPLNAVVDKYRTMDGLSVSFVGSRVDRFDGTPLTQQTPPEVTAVAKAPSPVKSSVPPTADRGLRVGK